MCVCVCLYAAIHNNAKRAFDGPKMSYNHSSGNGKDRENIKNLLRFSLYSNIIIWRNKIRPQTKH